MKKTLLILAASAAAALSAPVFAASAVIEQAKANCVVGEQNDGYLGFVSGSGGASAELQREVRATNQQRKAAYARLAAQNGVTIEVTAKLTAEKLINGASSGHCVQDASGRWIER